MRVLAALLTALALMTAPVAAQEKPPVPKGQAPFFCLASASKTDGKVTVRVTTLAYETFAKTVDGKQVLYSAAVWKDMKPLTLGDQVRVYRTDGKPADADAVLRAISKQAGIACIIAPDAEELPVPDPFYLGLLKEGTLVVVFKYKDVK